MCTRGGGDEGPTIPALLKHSLQVIVIFPPILALDIPSKDALKDITLIIETVVTL